MDIIIEPFDREEQDKALVAALTTTEATAVYLDTSALVWLYRIRPSARTEFVNFLDSEPLRERSHIPMWSLHELNKHRKSPKVLFPLPGQHANLKNAIELIQSNAHLFVDDKFASGTAWGTQAAYIQALTDASEAMLKVAKPLSQGRQVYQIDKELSSFFKNHALNRPVPQLAPLREEFLARCEGRLPPGYEDRGKGGADAEASSFSGANRFGDFVFWRSLVEHAAIDKSVKSVVIISHDAKGDWVHRPNRYVGYGQVPTSNNDKKASQYTCPHPLLSYEIRVEAGVERLFIVSIMQLVSAFSQLGVGKDFKELARAIQIEADDAEDAGSQDTEEPTTEPDVVEDSDANGEDHDQDSAEPPGEPALDNLPVAEQAPDEDLGQTAERLAQLPAFALADKGYVSDPQGNPEADKVISELRSINWYIQNPAVQRLPDAVMDATTTDAQRFLLGRNLYQAACGNAWRALDFLDTLSAWEIQCGDSNFELVFAGAIFEAYFDPEGNPRPRLKDQLLDNLFALAERPEFEAATAWLRNRLAPLADHLILYPGGPRQEAVFEITLDEEGCPTQISVAGTIVTKLHDTNEDLWDGIALPAKGTNERLINVFASAFDLPLTKIRIEPEIVEPLNFANLRLLDWSTNGDITFVA